MAKAYNLTFISSVIAKATDMANARYLTFISGVIVTPQSWRTYTISHLYQV